MWKVVYLQIKTRYCADHAKCTIEYQVMHSSNRKLCLFIGDCDFGIIIVTVAGVVVMVTYRMSTVAVIVVGGWIIGLVDIREIMFERGWRE